MSFSDRQGILESLIHNVWESNRVREDSVGQEKSVGQYLKHLLHHTRKKSRAKQNKKEYNSDKKRFEDDVMALRDLCFMFVIEDGATFEIHSLIQLATRKWLVGNGTVERWKNQFVSNHCEAFPTGKYENWPMCQALFANVKSAVEHQPRENSSLVEWATLLYHAAWYSERVGNIADATSLAVKALKERKKVLGLKHEDTLWSMGMVALAYKLAGRWNAVEELEVQVMETRKKKLGADHPSTLTIMGNLTLTLWN